MEKLYVNENFPFRTVELLRTFGHDVLTSLEAGNANQRIPDDDVLAFSTTQNRILLTLNRRDFIKLHFQNSQHSGIIVCTTDANFDALAQRIQNVLLENTGNFEGILLRVNKGD
jgi:predicted nuclease of predicted toxin-antitoxin system